MRTFFGCPVFRSIQSIVFTRYSFAASPCSSVLFPDGRVSEGIRFDLSPSAACFSAWATVVPLGSGALLLLLLFKVVSCGGASFCNVWSAGPAAAVLFSAAEGSSSADVGTTSVQLNFLDCKSLHSHCSYLPSLCKAGWQGSLSDICFATEDFTLHWFDSALSVSESSSSTSLMPPPPRHRIFGVVSSFGVSISNDHLWQYSFDILMILQRNIVTIEIT